MVFGLNKGAHTTTLDFKMSINLALFNIKEEEIVHKMIKDMDLGIWESYPINIGQDEVNNKHIFHYL